ncbi:ADP-ribose pyrophosphatase [Metallosphaera sp. J1]|uniref:NUDIX hydrolase n=1 Tax=Metallosphaera javensis (ex Hofmann et al. 2022) TaxID=99938 RepID=UPI001EDF0A62|nr:NUDIX hydrolase [Metallosphaera javensis (ex Hofmann et al. 2022)]MCG3108540.1 ADP-ribose pyrophosphatase [Metallosphaera javensis (ex Hofmann et al. 2022)]
MQRPLVAVGSVIFNLDKVLLVRRLHPPNQDKWAIPGGKVEFGESIRDAVIRETAEETGLQVEPRVLMAVVEVFREGYHYVILDFICEVRGGELKASSDAGDARYFSLEEIRKLNVSSTTLEMLERFWKGEKMPYLITEISR